jgi:hypothetical protein
VSEPTEEALFGAYLRKYARKSGRRSGA